MVWLIGLSGIAWPGFAEPRPESAATHLIVKLRAEGPAAIEACAEGLARRGRSFASAARDGSGSLDQVFRTHQLGSPRVVFPMGGRASGLEQRRDALREIVTIRRPSRPPRPGPLQAGQRGAGPAESDPPLPDLAPIYRVEVPGGADLDSALAALAKDPHVEYVQIDHLNRLDQLVPGRPLLSAAPPFDDPFLGTSGAWGQPYADLWGLPRIKAPAVWDRARGDGIVVAVVDTGLDATHPDIAANVWVNPGEDQDGDGRATSADRNGRDDDGNGLIDDLTGFDFANSVDANDDGDFDDPGDVSDPDPSDDVGHGTHVAGTIAAVAGNGIGIAGVAPGARIMALKGFPADGPARDSVLWRAVLYAAAQGAAVVNNSWSCGSPCPVNPLAEEVLELVEALGTLVVTSAGNAGSDVAFISPENGSRVLTVGAIGVDDALPAFSNRGWLIDVVAPGGGPDHPFSIPVARRNILSLRARDGFPTDQAFFVGEDYLRLAGTSMSSPHVAGAVAVLRGHRPELSPADVRRLVRLAAQDLGEAGHDPVYGAGALDLEQLIDAALPDAALVVDAPRVGSQHDPAQGPLVLRGLAAGSDLASLELAVAPGLSGRAFVPLQSFGTTRIDWTAPPGSGAFVAHWDTTDAADGPWVVRARARLRDGRLLEEHILLGIERNPALRISRSEGEATSPDLSGHALVWRLEGAGEGSASSALVVGRFPDPPRIKPFSSSAPIAREIRIDRPRSPLAPVRDGRDLAWLEQGDGPAPVLLHCRLSSAGACHPVPATSEAGSVGSVFLARGWLVWSRSEGPSRFVEGCPIAHDRGRCAPRDLVDPGLGSDWNLRSFDGDSLLVGRPGELVRCRIGLETPYCVPEPIVFPDGELPSDPRHDGDLLAFSRSDVEIVRPPGCLPSDVRPACARRVVAVVEYLACMLEREPASAGPTGAGVCEPIVLSERQPVERAQGFAVSGRRIVWSIGTAEEEASLRYCELDAPRRACPVQRIGGILAPQLEPAIDGNRIVWSDGRDGDRAIRGLAVPALLGPVRQVVEAGRPFAILFWADPGSSSSLRHAIEGLAGIDPAAAEVRILDPGTPGGAILLHGRIPKTSTPRATWRLSATNGGGLVTTSVLELVVRRRR